MKLEINTQELQALFTSNFNVSHPIRIAVKCTFPNVIEIAHAAVREAMAFYTFCSTKFHFDVVGY